MTVDDVRQKQRTYWTFARMILPRAHFIMNVALIIGTLVGSILLIVGIAAWEIWRGNYNFFSDWKDWVVAFWNDHLEPYWDIIKIIIAISLPVVIGIGVFLLIMLITALTLFYRLAFPKADLWWEEPSGLLCYGGSSHRLLWRSDMGHWANWLAAWPDKLIWYTNGYNYKPPEWSTEHTGMRTYLFISGTWRYIKSLLFGFSSDMDSHTYSKEYKYDRKSIWECDIFGPETIENKGDGIVEADGEPNATKAPLAAIDDANENLIEDGLKKARKITKINKLVATMKEVTGVAAELPDYAIDKLREERNGNERLHLLLWTSIKADAEKASRGVSHE